MALPDAGYSGTPLPRKLGLKPGQRRLVVGAPAALHSVWPAEGTRFAENVADPGAGLDVVHLFAVRQAALAAALPVLRGALQPAGMLWVSWPKRAASVPTDVTEDTIRTAALAAGLVDIKVCAVDATWSGLKLVIPVKDR